MIKVGNKVVDMKSIKGNTKSDFVKEINDGSYDTGLVNKVSKGYAYVKFLSRGNQLIPIELTSLKQMPNGIFIDDADGLFKNLYEMKLAEKVLLILEKE